MDVIKNGWFVDLNEKMWPGEGFALKVKKVLFHEKSKYQDILVFESESYGTVLCLDGCIQVTERDEFSYQEMCTFLPLNSHPNPERVLVVGGGDGGVVREVVKHPCVKEVTLCEIDQMVMDVSKKYLPNMAIGLSSPKCKIFTGDGFQYLKEHVSYYDVIITDSSDPETNSGDAPAASLFQDSYFELLHSALRDGGITCSQGETMWYDLDLISKLKTSCEKIFPVVSYAYVCIPSYIGGQIGFLLNSKNKDTKFQEPVHQWSDEECEKFGLRYYNKDIHKSSFVLPRFASQVLHGNPE